MHHGAVVGAAGQGGPKQRGLLRGEDRGAADSGAGRQTAAVAGGDCIQEQFTSAECGKVSKEQFWGEGQCTSAEGELSKGQNHRGEHSTRAKGGEAAGRGSGSAEEVAVVAKVTSATKGKVSKECFHSAEEPHQEQIAVEGEAAQESAQEQVTKKESNQEPNTWGASSFTCEFFDISQGGSAEATGGTGEGNVFLNAIIWAAEGEAAEWQQAILAAEGEIRCSGTLGDAHTEQFFLCKGLARPQVAKALHRGGQCRLGTLEEQGSKQAVHEVLSSGRLLKHAGVDCVTMSRWRVISIWQMYVWEASVLHWQVVRALDGGAHNGRSLAHMAEGVG